MTVGEEADDDEEEDDEEPEDDLHLPVPQGGGASQLPGLTDMKLWSLSSVCLQLVGSG